MEGKDLVATVEVENRMVELSKLHGKARRESSQRRIMRKIDILLDMRALMVRGVQFTKEFLDSALKNPEKAQELIDAKNKEVPLYHDEITTPSQVEIGR